VGKEKWRIIGIYMDNRDIYEREHRKIPEDYGKMDGEEKEGR